MDEKQLAKLIKKNAAKAAKRPKVRKYYDATLEATRPPESETDADLERADFFAEMKKREF